MCIWDALYLCSVCIIGLPLNVLMRLELLSAGLKTKQNNKTTKTTKQIQITKSTIQQNKTKIKHKKLHKYKLQNKLQNKLQKQTNYTGNVLYDSYMSSGRSYSTVLLRRKWINLDSHQKFPGFQKCRLLYEYLYEYRY